MFWARGSSKATTAVVGAVARTLCLRHKVATPRPSYQSAQIGTSAFRLTDRACVPTNLTTPPLDSELPVTHQFQQPPAVDNHPPTFFSGLLRHQQPKCRTLARRSSLERPRGLCRPRRPRNGTLLMTSRSPRKSVHPVQNEYKCRKERRMRFCMDECDSRAGSIELGDKLAGPA